MTLPVETITYWQEKVAGSIRVLQQQDISLIAQACLDHQLKEGWAATWHESARFYGHKCNCMRCNPISRIQFASAGAQRKR